ncbi:hypothetical protein CORC01_08668 [Colletotrichum orchidophilum]|uniref:Clr5 domain-containing protein n=1 Tax=Colletotrichum orchidophilum TaxID=1209926 RepID=A0A1G4B3T2_9PEZI|nr:uncharacterized protein CORC01_08668 [Colletotrichum orchidophilum]OHE95975.1 hypothetical protein CORC01_08668 [Colletotrichum orchidophilum]
MDPPLVLGPAPVATFHHIPYEQRWEPLKDIIVKAFLGDDTSRPLTFPKLSEFMTKHHGFKALPAQYRYRLSQWGIRKNTKKDEKTALITAIGKRNRPGSRISDVEIRQGELMRPVDSKQVKRFINDTIRHYPTPPMTPGMLSQWNLPYAAYRASLTRQDDQASPFSHNPPTPQYLHVNSPEASAGQTSDMTPTSALIRRKTLLDRASLLLQGRREELLSGCNVDDRRTISDWLHDYWMHSFVTAKFWGVGPQEWTARLISEVTLGSAATGTPQTLQSPLAWASAPSPRELLLTEAPQPTNLCHWVIHSVDGVVYEDAESPPREEQARFDLDDQSSWTEWPVSAGDRSYQSSMQEAFTHNRFSTIAPDDVPIANEVVSEIISKSPTQLKLDSWAFAIMAGNLELISKLLIDLRHSFSPAVCHSMMAIFLPPSRPNINAFSGLFRRRCTNCGLEMKLGPLHTLVVVAFHLAENGKSGETLFGALACLVCLLVLGADASQAADLSVLAIFSSPDEEECRHRRVTAMELAEQVPEEFSDGWKPSCKLGWRCLLLILRHATTSPQQEKPFVKFSNRTNLCCFPFDDTKSDEWDDLCPMFEEHESVKLPRVNRNLGDLWATIQTEILTYRKITSIDPSISDHFQLSSLLRWLEQETESFETPLLTDGMINTHTPCGWFGADDTLITVVAGDMCSRYFMNLDIWSRASFVDVMVPIGYS